MKIPANHSATPANDSEPTTNAHSGRKWREPFATYDPLGLCWRMLQPSLPLNLDEPRQIWPASGMWDSGAAYAHPMSAPAIGETEYSSLLPTLDASMGNGGRQQSREALLSGKHQVNLNDLPRLLPTPTARDWKDGPPNQHVETNGVLGREVWNLLPTPDASMGNGGRQRSNAALTAGTHQANLNDLPRLLPTPTATPYGNNQSDSPNAAVRPSLNGVFTNPQSDDGNTPPDEPPPNPQTPAETAAGAYQPDLWNG